MSTQIPLAQVIAGIKTSGTLLEIDHLRNYKAIKLALDYKISSDDFKVLLELGNIADQDYDNVSITGGALSGVSITNATSITGSYIRPKTVKETLAAHRTLVANEANRFLFNPNGGTWNVNLWAGGALGDTIKVKNIGTSGKLQCRFSSSNIALLLSGEVVEFTFDGTSTWERM